MKVYTYPADTEGCGLHRLIWASKELIRQGHNVKMVLPQNRAGSLQGAISHDGELVDVTVPPDADVIVLQRITHKHLVSATGILRARGIAVVVDMDDDLATINPKNPAFRSLHPVYGKHPDHSWQHAQRACEAATLVTTSTPALQKRYAPHGRGFVLYNCIPKWYLGVEHQDSEVIGWAGSLHSHPDDLKVTGSAIMQVTSESAPFHMIGPGDGIRDELRLPYEPVATGPLDPLKGWPNGVASLGIGVAPLADTTFNQSKSWLKPLEFAALGVPCVMSPSTEYRRINELGVGILARKPRQWATTLRSLQSSAALRAEVAARGREAATKWTVEDNAYRWWDAWTEAYKLEH